MRQAFLLGVKYGSGLVAAAFLILLGTYVALGAPVAYGEGQTIGSGVTSFEQLSKRFTDLARAKGGAYAFEVLKKADLPPDTDLHLLGHAVGDVLYEQKGVGGIAYCTQDFRNACSHSIVINAFLEYGGEGALPYIHEACLHAPGGSGAYTMCYHGLGHGVFAYYQYSLPEAIAMCKKTGTAEHHDQEYVECVGGVIMELMGGGGHDTKDWELAQTKYLKPDDPLAPCDQGVVPAEVQTICLTYLTPHIWQAAGIELSAPDPMLFAKAFSYCDALKEPELRDACFGGFGKEFVPLAGARDIRNVDKLSDFSYSLAGSWCGFASDQEGTYACLHQAVASIFWGGENDPDGAIRFCSDVGDSAGRRSCFESLSMEVNRYVLDTERQKEICGAFPEEYRNACPGL